MPYVVYSSHQVDIRCENIRLDVYYTGTQRTVDERRPMEQLQWHVLLALLNLIVFLACLADWNETPSVKNLFAMLAWGASTSFWLTRCEIPV